MQPCMCFPMHLISSKAFSVWAQCNLKDQNVKQSCSDTYPCRFMSYLHFKTPNPFTPEITEMDMNRRVSVLVLNNVFMCKHTSVSSMTDGSTLLFWMCRGQLSWVSVRRESSAPNLLRMIIILKNWPWQTEPFSPDGIHIHMIHLSEGLVVKYWVPSGFQTAATSCKSLLSLWSLRCLLVI